VLGIEKRLQLISKVTCHRSETTHSRQIRCVHEDPRAHQSYQTALRQAMTHIHDMRAHLVVSRPRIGQIGHSPRSADHGRPTICRRPTGLTTSQSVRGSVWLVLHVGLGKFSSKWLVIPPYIRGKGLQMKTSHISHFTLQMAGDSPLYI